jgi:hypothetical protein
MGRDPQVDTGGVIFSIAFCQRFAFDFSQYQSLSFGFEICLRFTFFKSLNFALTQCVCQLLTVNLTLDISQYFGLFKPIDFGLEKRLGFGLNQCLNIAECFG